MSQPDRTIPQRELRNDVSRVLREVEGGNRVRVTVDGRPVADLVPVAGARPRFASRDVLLGLARRRAPEGAVEQWLDELRVSRAEAGALEDPWERWEQREARE